MPANETIPGIRKRGWFAGLLLLVLASAIGGIVFSLRKPGPPPNSGESKPAKRWIQGRINLDESGYELAYRLAGESLQDPTSLQSIATAFHHIGYRSMPAFRSSPGQSPDEQLNNLVAMARLYAYEGDFVKAAEVLGKARALANRDPDRFAGWLPSLIFYQGVLALRRGEVENCVECPCQSSCIFPLQPQAVHQKREGSTQAIPFFLEYLEGWPDDIGAQWLLNVAHMTLGTYPDGVPPQYRLPLEPFRSEFDIGRFVDVAPALGLDRLHWSGGAIMDDFDNDGWLDLVETASDPSQSMAFYRNQGDGTFRNRAREAGLEEQTGGLQCMQTDYNNDGWLDILICRGGWTIPQRLSLLRNDKDGTFTDVTRQAGLLQAINSQAACWADYDNDGWVDLFVGAESVPSRLYHNRGDGTFEEVAAKAGVSNVGMRCKGANWGDYDRDGYPDLFVNNLNGPPRLFHNNKNGTFSNVATRMGINDPRSGFSCWFWDYDNDGWLDLFAAGYRSTLNDVINSHLGRPHQGCICRLYRNHDGRWFEDVTRAAGLDLAMLPMGSNFGDFDGDGFLDFYLATGDPAYSMLMPNRMFKNVGGKRFADITTSSGTGHLQKGHGVACGDWDRNGSIDLFVQMGGAIPGDRSRSVFFQNPTSGRHWITVRLVGKKSNRAAIGARIKVTIPSAPEAIYRHVTSGSSFGGNPLQQTIGLGTAGKITTLEVQWPTSGTTQVFHDVPADQAIEIVELEETYRKLNWLRSRSSEPRP